MYNTGVEIPKVSFADLSYSGIPINSYFMGFDLDNAGKLSKLDNTGTVTVIEGGSGGGITLTNLSANAPLTYNNVNGAFSITKSTGSTSGYLSSTDWAMFNSKQGSLTLTTTGSSGAATLTGNTLNIPQYSGGAGGITLTSLSANVPLTYNNTNGAFSINQSNGSTNGYLSSTDWTVFNSKIGAASGTNNYVAKFTPNGTTIGNSQIQDDGTKIGINSAPDVGSKIYILSDQTAGINLNSNVSNINTAVGINLSVSGTNNSANTGIVSGALNGNSTTTGVQGSASSSTGVNKGIEGIASGTSTNIGLRGYAVNGSSNYSIQLQDGTQTVAGRFLKNMNTSGQANWANITAADVSGVQGALTLTTTGSSGAATLTGNTLNIPQYSGGTGSTLPAHIEYNETAKTLWNNGKGNISENSSFGELALSSNTTGSSNTAIGYRALQATTTSNSNTAVGSFALWQNTTGNSNIAIGGSSLYGNTTGSNNIALGNGALSSNTTGYVNISIGEQALYNHTTGGGNIAIGANTVSGNFSNSIILGQDATATSDNQFVVGSTTYNAGLITSETITPTRTWKVKINGVDYKIPMVPA